MHKYLAAMAMSALVLTACSDSPTAVNPETEPNLAARPAVAGRFIVTLKERTNPAGVAREHGVRPDFVYTHALTGFAGAISDAARQGLLRDSRVVRVEADGIATIVNTQTNATWGIDRVDQSALPLSGTYTYSNTGSGVRAYIIDTGIRTSHTDFGGRAASGYDAVDGGAADDCNGHGTHVAGTVGGSTYGVAKGVSLVAVRVLNCSGSGTWSGVIAGIDWVTGTHATGDPAVANLSLGGGANLSVDTAVRNMIADGVATAVAAGNGNAGGRAQDACKYSPARVAEAMTIGATDKTDKKASWSNYGNCVDWFAPGVGITSAWHTSISATNTISGTSMATPHTAGVAALYLQSNPGATAQVVRDALSANTTKGIVTGSKTVNNNLLFSNY
ncbi:MAG TPA: S8 family serine peptidase [Gemmatimonadales bacterium]|nr:S8 family serine peptidase [Gemmatimonadales bacterium]